LATGFNNLAIEMIRPTTILGEYPIAIETFIHMKGLDFGIGNYVIGEPISVEN